jgi:hypothetical protein
VTVTTPFWRSVEALNNFVYLVPEAQSHYKPIGLKGSWMGYFASRAAPLGAASPELVIATFHGFAPHLVHRAIPDAWQFASPESILAARLDLATEVLGRAVTGEQVAPLANAMTTIVAGLDFAGKPLAAAHASVPLPDDDLGRFWLLDAVLREYRGDCHVALLVAEGLNGVDSNVLNVAAGRTFPQQQALRGWTDEEWTAGKLRLRERGWLDDDDAITEAGTEYRNELEDATDRACAAGMNADAVTHAEAITDDLRAAARALRASLKAT